MNVKKHTAAVAVAAVAAAAAAGVVGLNALPDDAAAVPSADGHDAVVAAATPPAGGLSADAVRIIESLNTILNEEVTERRLLADEVAQLRLELAELQARFAPRPAEAGEPASETFDRSEMAERRLRERDERLLAAGFDTDKIERLRKREGDAAMQRLYLRDKAIREGWYNTPRYSEAVSQLPQTMQVVREELSDDDYERYLFAGGRPNRVTVQAVIDTSPAQVAGLRPGDTLLSYDGQRIFSTSDLIDATSRGAEGGTAIVEIERGGQRRQVYIRRGPLGIQTGLDHVNPDIP